MNPTAIIVRFDTVAEQAAGPVLRIVGFARARDLLQSVEPYGILITNGDNDSFPLWYAQEVEGVRRDVSVVLTPYLGTDWYVRQLMRRTVLPYDGSGLPAFSSSSVARPTRPMFAMTDEQADAIPPYVELRETQEFNHGGIHATILPGVLTRDQLVVLRLIADTFPARPVYFSMGRYPHSMGLGEHVVSHGLAQRLVNAPASTMPGIVSYPGGYLDVERTHALWKRFRAPRALLADGDWVDDASITIPTAYVATGQLVAQGLAAQGRAPEAGKVMAETEALARKLRLLPASR